MYNPNLNNILLTNAKDLKELGFLTEELDEALIPNAIKFIGDSRIQHVLGTKLYFILLQEISDKIDNVNHIIPDKYLVLLDNYIYSALGYLVQSELLLPVTNKLRNKGLLTTSDDKVTPVDYGTIKSSLKYYEDRGEFYLDMLSKFIYQNNTLYPEFFDVDDCGDKISNLNTFKSPFGFGNQKNKCRHYR